MTDDYKPAKQEIEIYSPNRERYSKEHSSSYRHTNSYSHTNSYKPEQSSNDTASTAEPIGDVQYGLPAWRVLELREGILDERGCLRVDEDELRRRIDDYFRWFCGDSVYEYGSDGKIVVSGEGFVTKSVKPTLNGLGNFLGLLGDMELMEYSYRRIGWWNRVLQMGHSRIKESVEGLWLEGKNVKEWMGNMGWKVGASGEEVTKGGAKGGLIKEVRVNRDDLIAMRDLLRGEI